MDTGGIPIPSAGDTGGSIAMAATPLFKEAQVPAEERPFRW